MALFRKDTVVFLCLFLLSLFVFSRGLNIHGLEYRDDEIFYFQSTQEMLKSGDILSPTYFGEDRFQKPILYYWLVLLSYKLFGIGWFSARFVRRRHLDRRIRLTPIESCCLLRHELRGPSYRATPRLRPPFQLVRETGDVSPGKCLWNLACCFPRQLRWLRSC